MKRHWTAGFIDDIAHGELFSGFHRKIAISRCVAAYVGIAVGIHLEVELLVWPIGKADKVIAQVGIADIGVDEIAAGQIGIGYFKRIITRR